MLVFILIMCSVVTMALVIVTIFLVLNSKKKLKNYGRCKGTIIKIIEQPTYSSDGPEKKIIYPIVKYDINRKTYENKANCYLANIKVGQELELLYNPKDFSKIIVNKNIFLAPIITGILSAAGIISTIIIYILI